MAMAQNITVIPAKRTIGTQKPTQKVQKIRVAAYCRVSTEYEEQESSYEVQVEHYTSYINSKPEWQMVEVYADDGISATSTAKRDEFNRMIADCKAGKIDMILTKSISRFARNTVDCLKYTRELKALNIAVFFEKENINTLDAKGEVLITIMAALAQQESESLSANVRLGIQFRNQQGQVRVNHNWFLGYTKDEDGKLVIVPEEAEIVLLTVRQGHSGKKTFRQRWSQRSTMPGHVRIAFLPSLRKIFARFWTGASRVKSLRSIKQFGINRRSSSKQGTIRTLSRRLAMQSLTSGKNARAF